MRNILVVLSGRRLSVSGWFLHKNAHIAKLGGANRQLKRKDVDTDRIRADYDLGMSMWHIAKKYDVDCGTIKRRLNGK